MSAAQQAHPGSPQRRVAGASLLLIVFALLVIGCRGSGSASSASGRPSPAADPFAGTWRMDSGDRVLFVISANGHIYTVVQGSPGAPDYVPLAVLRRSGDQLSGDATITDTNGRLTLSLGTGPAQLALNFDEPKMNGPFDTTLTRVSASTATPKPVP